MEKELNELRNQELIQKAKKRKSTDIINALLIGIMIGIGIYSIVKNGFGIFTLIPLYFVYKAINNAKK